MSARAIMVQGTASSVGKSLLVAALCRYFRREGLRVAPFKAQNMALNSAVTPDGFEIGRAQAVQADAAGVIACVDMNPVLLKPEGDQRSQVVVLGKPLASLSASEYHAYKPQLCSVIAGSLARLRARHDLIVIEGAGSPAEINLKDRDIVNMHVARVAEAPVLLAGDIDRGGVFAALVGTLELLEPDERARIAAFVINKFRGDRALLAPGLDMLTARTGKPVLGVLPYLPRLRIADEDSVSLEHRVRRARGHADDTDIVVVRLPRISNHDDVEPLEHEPGVTVRFAERVEELAGADLVILPGSKNTASDLTWLRETELAYAIGARARAGQPVLGICGGCQMLGERVEDPLGIESPQPVTAGLGLLPLRTRFAPEKITARVSARVLSGSFLAPEGLSDLAGYEIHMGTLTATEPCPAPFQIQQRSGRTVDVRDGAIGCEGAVVGTMLHGLFENDALRGHMLDTLRARRGLVAPSGAGAIAGKQSEYDRLEAALRDNIDRGLLLRIVDLA